MKIRSLAVPLTLAFLSLPGALWATTPVSGNIRDLGTIPIGSGAYIRFTLRGCQGSQPTVPNVAILAGPGQPYYKDFVFDANGNVSGTLYSTRDATGILGGEIECPTNVFTAAWYGMTIWIGGRAGPETPVHARNGVTLDPGTVPPLAGNPVIIAPNGDSTYARLDGGNQPFSGNVTAPNVTATNQLKSTVATGTAPLSVTSTTQVPNLNASQLGGLNPPASAIVGISDNQALTSKTFDISANTLKSSTNTAGHVPRNNGTQYVDGQLAAADLSDGVIGSGSIVKATALQGTDANVLTAGTVSASTGVPLCTDANHGATTSGCASGAEVVLTANGQTSLTIVCQEGASGSNLCAETVFANAHTLVRLTYNLSQAPATCSPNAVIAVRDVTAGSNLTTITVNQGVAGFVDSGALSIATTAGHKILVGANTAAAGCGTVPNANTISAVFQ